MKEMENIKQKRLIIRYELGPKAANVALALIAALTIVTIVIIAI